jgi:hypothetical protein
MTAAPSHASADWASPRRRLRLRWLLALAAVAMLHLLILLLLQRALRLPAPQPAPAQAPVVLVWLAPPARAEAPAAEPPAQRAPTRRARPAAPAAARADTLALPPAAAANAASAPALAASAPAGAATAAASAAGGNLLDTEASRRAIREAARQRPIGEMGAQATGEPAPLSAEERLAQEIARGARGDCLKGEYAGSGMGLLSLPFWLMAEMRDKCRR